MRERRVCESAGLRMPQSWLTCDRRLSWSGQGAQSALPTQAFRPSWETCSQGQTHPLLMESGKSFPFQSLFPSREEFSLSPSVR